MIQEHDWYFDIVSPYGYLQWKQRGRFNDRLRLKPVPILFAAVLDHWGQKGPAEIMPKRLFTYRSVQWRAEKLGIPLRFPDTHPFNPLSGLRLIIAAGSTEGAVDAVCDEVWGSGSALTDDKVSEIGRRLGLADVAARIADPAVKLALRTNTEQAVARGVFGVPTTVVNDVLFWGDDSTPMLLDYLSNPGLFRAEEMQRLETITPGAARKPA